MLKIITKIKRRFATSELGDFDTFTKNLKEYSPEKHKEYLKSASIVFDKA